MLLSTIPVFLVGTASYSSSRRTVVDKITNYSLENLMQSASNLRAQIQKYEDFSVQLQVNLRHQHEIKDYIINHAPSAKENI